MSEVHEIVLLGANMSGIPMAHYLLKHTIPHLNALDPSRNFHLTIISPNTAFYWKLGSPAAISGHPTITNSALSTPISSILSQYPSSSYKHILGRVVSVNPESKTVNFDNQHESKNAEMDNSSAIPTSELPTSAGASAVTYQSLILATGRLPSSALFAPHPNTKALDVAQSRLVARLADAKTVLVAGGGPVGVESAAALKSAHKHLEVTLYAGGARLLEHSVPQKVSSEAERLLVGLGVKVVYSTKIVSAVSGTKNVTNEGHREDNAQPGDGGSATVNFDDGSEKEFDVYIRAIMSGKNGNFLPEEWLSENGVRANRDSMRVNAHGVGGVYVLGDANENSDGQFLWATDGVKPLADSLLEDVTKMLGGTSQQGKPRKFKTFEGMIVVPIGNSGTGFMKFMRAPGWFVHWFKGNYLVDRFMPDWVSGKALAKP